MTLAELMARFRREEKDTVVPYHWAPEDLTAWLNEAQEEACRRALLLVDSMSTASTASFAAGATGVKLNDSVIYVRRATLASSSIPLTPRVARSMDEEVPGWEGSMASVPRVFVPDWQTGYLRFWPPAAAAGSVHMTVVRTPLEPMVADTDEPEIRSQYHAYLLDWVRFRAYDVMDADRFDPQKSAKNYTAFVSRFGETSAVGEHWALEQYYDVGAN